MLFVTNTDGKQKSWHIGESWPIYLEEVNAIDFIQADGDELDFIQLNFLNLPDVPNCRVVRYYGDHAKFIAGNIKARLRTE